MFRQVIAHRWADGVTGHQRAAFQAGVGMLGEIPEVTAVLAGPDAGLFPGNHHFVTVLDFPDADAAARYVAHPIHQAFIAGHRSLMRDRVIVQQHWGAGELTGLHHAKLPVSDVAASRNWYIDALGFLPGLEFEEDGTLTGASVRHPAAHLRLALRRDPERAAALAGFDALCFSVSNDTDLDKLTGDLNNRGISHSGRNRGREGWVVKLADPDGIGICIYSLQRGQPCT